MSDKAKDSPGPLTRYIDVLELIASFSGALTLADVSSLLGLPKTTAHRLLKGLVRSNLAKEGDGGRTYQLGERVTRLLHASAEEGWLASLAGPHLRALSETTSEACFLARLVGVHVFVAVSEAPDMKWIQHVTEGSEMPVNASASGKAIMAYQSRELIAEALAEDLPKPTPLAHTSRRWIEKEFSTVREQGYATCVGEIYEGSAALACPIMLPGGSVLYSVAISGPLDRVMDKKLPQRVQILRDAADALAKALSLGASIKSRR
jgi:DNA-binding IclR family transcriptional regulator